MEGNKRVSVLFIFLIVLIILLVSNIINLFKGPEEKNSKQIISSENSENFKIISSSENEDLEDILKEYAKSQNIDLQIDYAGTLEIMDKLNSGEKYDAVWASNSIWLYMLDESVQVKESKSTSINPVIFAIKREKAEELDFIDNEIYTNDIIQKIKDGDLKFSMSNPTQTNTGATAYLGLLSAISGNPEVLKQEHLENQEIKQELITLFTGLERSSGSESFLEEMFLNSTYEAVVTYESSIINMNQKLEKQGKEPLYALYPIDGISISDSPFAYINNNEDSKKEIFSKLQNFILSSEGQEKLAEKGRRTWYGGINKNSDKNIFNHNWGIDTEKYIVPIKFPNKDIIQSALALYQSELRKPVHTIFALDYSGSMLGEGNEDLSNAMKYILTQEEASKDLLQFSEKDKITVIPFSSDVINVWQTEKGNDTKEILDNISNLKPRGGTNIYDTSIEAIKLLANEDADIYNLSVILMTDGISNMGDFYELKNEYLKLQKDIPIYSIMFGSAYEGELQEIADLSNAKIFDGKTDLLKAFKEVRGYN